MGNFILCTPASSGLSLHIARYLFQTTTLPIVATYREGSKTDLRRDFLKPFSTQLLRGTLSSSRLHLLRINVSDEKSMRKAIDEIPILLGSSSTRPTLRWAWITPGLLHPEKRLADLDPAKIRDSFNTNVIGHMLMIKHFSPMLPDRFSPALSRDELVGLPTSFSQDVPPYLAAQWVHMSARVGSISDNKLGGWFSYRSSKAALNQVTKTFDLYLKQKKVPAVAVGMHPGTVKTNLGKGEFWRGVEMGGGKLWMPDEAAKNVVSVARGLGLQQGGRCWDWKGEEVPP